MRVPLVEDDRRMSASGDAAAHVTELLRGGGSERGALPEDEPSPDDEGDGERGGEDEDGEASVTAGNEEAALVAVGCADRPRTPRRPALPGRPRPRRACR
ncbi:hypothetical protein ABZ957_25995 [Streptomyces sp. NPDC046316]|uniref:hypothetical protein n=1 Tax=Streptomyces sp. NPDC046316 TaxID=3154494 RepID=UPI0033F062FC